MAEPIDTDRRQPWLKFFVNDWRSDAELKQCTLAARGLWIECLTIMHVARPYGHLVSPSGAIYQDRELARAVSASTGQVRRLLDELLRWGVASKTEAGVIFSRRMVRDQRDRDYEATKKRDQRSGDIKGDKAGDIRGDAPRVRVSARAASDSDSDSPSASGVLGSEGDAGKLAAIHPRDRMPPSLIQGRGPHLRHASCGPPCVPETLHAEFIAKMRGDPEAADATLKAWYDETRAAWRGAFPADDFSFWRARHAAKWPMVKPATGGTGAAPAGKYAHLGQGDS